MGKPIHPIIEIQKGGSIVNVITTTVQTENVISDTYKVHAWELPVDTTASALYIDGIFKGMSFFASEEGVILSVKKDVEIRDKDNNILTVAYKGIIGKYLDASMHERGSALKVSMMQTIIYCIIVLIMGFMMGMSYGA